MTSAAYGASPFEEFAEVISRVRELWLGGQGQGGRPGGRAEHGCPPGGRPSRGDLGARMSGPRGPGRGFGGPPPWAGWGGPPWGRPQGGRAPRGNVRNAILALLQEGPRHGYQLMQDIAERSHGQWRPSPGSVYPVLSSLADEGLVDDEKIEGRRVFSLTAAGRAYVEEGGAEIAGVFEGYRPESEQDADVRKLLMGVASAAVQVMASGDPAQVERGRAILARTRRELYAVLAEQDS